jgi:hypothetical protein
VASPTGVNRRAVSLSGFVERIGFSVGPDRGEDMQGFRQFLQVVAEDEMTADQDF